MEALDNTTIESAAITKLKDLLIQTCRVVPNIQENNTIPSWDGELYVYNGKSRDKGNLLGRIPVQVKGTVVKSYKKSFSVSIKDLQNYLKDNGVIFYVIKLTNFRNYRIYSKPLLPFDIERILKSATGQDTVSIKMNLIDNNNPDLVYEELVEFIVNRNMHRRLPEINSLYDLSISNIPVEGIGISVPALALNPTRDVYDTILGKEVFVYAKLRDINMQIVVDKITPNQVSQKIDESVYINGEPVSYGFSIGKQLGGQIFLELCEGLTLLVGQKDFSTQVNYKSTGSLKQQLTALKIFKAFLEGQSITIGAHKLLYKDCGLDDGSDVSEFYKRYEFLTQIQKVLDILHVKKDLDLNALTSRDEEKLKYLIDAFLYQKPVPITLPNHSLLGTMVIGNLKVIMYSKYIESTGKSKLHDIASLTNVTLSPKGSTEQSPCSIYVMFSHNALSTIDNMDLGIIEESILNTPLSQLYQNRIIIFILELLKFYDRQNEKDFDILDAVINLSTYIKNHSNDMDTQITCELNSLQANKRRRVLTFDENSYLIELKSYSKIPYTCLAASILLESFKEAEYIYSKFSQKEISDFQTYPITNLWPGHEEKFNDYPYDCLFIDNM